MKKLIISLLISLVMAILCVSCASARKENNSLRGLMLQENTKLPINKAYYSRHNVKARKNAHNVYGRR